MSLPRRLRIRLTTISSTTSLIQNMATLFNSSKKLRTAPKVIEIDGSILEGGGQILRNASAYSCILSKPVRLKNIRGKRHTPGLKQQHLSGLQLLEEITHGKLEGGFVKSGQISFFPGESLVTQTDFTSDQYGAGATSLVFQSALPVLLFLPQNTTLLLRGGTNVQNSPAAEYIEYILLPFLQRHFNISCQIQVRNRGFSSTGGGEVFVRVERLRRRLRCMKVRERGEIVEFRAVMWSARQEYKNVLKALEQSITTALNLSHPTIPLNITRLPLVPSLACGQGILLYAVTSTGHRIAASSMQQIPTRIQPGTLAKQELVALERGIEVVKKLQKQLERGGCVDEFLADQVVFFMALAVGQIEPGTTETNLVGVSEVNGTHGMDINGAEGTEILGEAGVVDGVGDGVDKCELLVGKIMVPNIYFTTEKRPEGEVIICQRNPSGQ